MKLYLKIIVIALGFHLISSSFSFDKDKVYVKIQLSENSFRHIELFDKNTYKINDSTQIELQINDLKDSLLISYYYQSHTIDSIFFLVGDSVSIDSFKVYDPEKDEFLYEVYPTLELIPTKNK